MSSKTVSVPKYRHHKGSGQAFVQIQSHRYYLGVWNSPQSKERYAAFIAEMAARPSVLPTAATSADAQITVTELCAAYWTFATDYYVQNGRATSQQDIIRQALRCLKNLYGHLPAAKFSPLAMQAIKQQLIDRGLARKTINHLCSTIKRLFKWAVSQQLVSVAVYQALLTVPGVAKGRTAAREPKPILPVEDDVVEATLPHVPPIVADMVRFQRLTGARPGEVCRIRPCDLKPADSVLEYRPADHKTAYLGRERTIYIGQKAKDILLPYLLRDAETYCFSPAESEAKRREEQRANRRTPVQPSQQNRQTARPKRISKTCYTKDSYNRAIARGIAKANAQRTKEAAATGSEPVLLPHWHPNQLRHAKATEVRRDYGIEAAQVILGHAKADVTQIYAERDARLAVKIAKKNG